MDRNYRHCKMYWPSPTRWLHSRKLWFSVIHVFIHSLFHTDKRRCISIVSFHSDVQFPWFYASFPHKKGCLSEVNSTLYHRNTTFSAFETTVQLHVTPSLSAPTPLLTSQAAGLTLTHSNSLFYLLSPGAQVKHTHTPLCTLLWPEDCWDRVLKRHLKALNPHSQWCSTY